MSQLLEAEVGSSGNSKSKNNKYKAEQEQDVYAASHVHIDSPKEMKVGNRYYKQLYQR